MISLAEVAEAEARYRRRREARDDVMRRVAEGRMLEVDEPDRVGRRLARLSTTTAMTAGTTSSASALDAEVTALERVLGTSDSLGPEFLARGAVAARSVGRIVVRTRPGLVDGFGTGFLVAPGLLLTAHHVLADPSTARHCEVGLDDDAAAGGVPAVFTLEPEAFFVTDAALAFTVVAVAAQGSGRPLEEFGWTPLIEAEGKVLLNERLNVVHHPDGLHKQLALRENRLVDVVDDFLQYVTGTAPASSGAPVFNDQWEVVGLHHAGVPRRDAQDRILSRSGEPWTPAMGEGAVDWVAGEGTRVSRICRRLRTAALPGAQAARRDRMLGAPADGTADTGQAEAKAASADPMATLPRVGVHASLLRLARSRKEPYYDEGSDDASRAEYYGGVDPGASGEELFRALSELVSATHHTTPDYRPHLELYPEIDLQPDGMLRSVYTGEIYSPEQLIVGDARTEQRLLQLRDAGTLAAIEEDNAAPIFNCEHVVPQSWFKKREPMRGDLHHLFTCQTECNGFRGSIPFFDFADFRDVVRERCGKQGTDRFEPNEGKGAVARATFYFLVRYPGLISRAALLLEEDRLEGLLRWHDGFPVSLHERHRNARIQARQGNRNPFIDNPAWAASAALATLGLG